MLTIKKVINHKTEVVSKLKKKNFDATEVLNQIEELYSKKKNTQIEYEQLLSKVHQISKDIGKHIQNKEHEVVESLKLEIAGIKHRAKELETTLHHLEDKIQDKLIHIPNIPHNDVPLGNTHEDNQIIKESIDNNVFSKTSKAHWDIVEKYNLIDFAGGTKITGAGFPIYRMQMAKLVRSLINYFLDFNIRKGYSEFLTPILTNEQSAFGTGQLPDKEGQMYYVDKDNLYLIPTAEVTLTNMYYDTIISEEELPIKLTGYTPCFRREAGSYGKDVRGLNRVHQFDKVEIVQIAHPDHSYTILDEMVSHVEELLKSLELPYRIVRLCGGDMSFASALTYDFEVFANGQKKWLEVSSVSNFEEFQSNRMKIRIKSKNKQKVTAHTLNGSSLALPRIIAAIIENNYNEGGITIPKVLVPYFGSDQFSLKN